MTLLNRMIRRLASAVDIRVAIAGGAALLVVGMWAAMIIAAADHLRDDLQDTKVQLASLATAFEEHLVRTLNRVDRVLQRVEREVEVRGAGAAAMLASERERQRNLFAGALVADARGRVVASSPPSGLTTVADRDWFKAHAENKSTALLIGKAVQDAASGRWTWYVTRRTNQPDGSFGGVIGVQLEPGYFKRFYRGTSPGTGHVITLFGRDGVLILRQEESSTPARQSGGVTSAVLDAINRGTPRGSLIAESPVDRLRYVVGYRALDAYPLVVIATVPERTALARAAAQAQRYYAGAGIFMATVAFMVVAVVVLLGRDRRGAAALAASESRFRSLTALGSDWYWETDWDYRFTVMSGRVSRSFGIPSEFLGKTRWELDFIAPVDGDWDEHRRQIEERRAFRNLVLRYTGSGGVSFSRISGEPMYDDAGAFTGYRGVGSDITPEVRLQQRLKMQHAVTHILAQATAVDTAMAAVLETVCRTLDWQWGARRVVDRATDTLRCAESWCAPQLADTEFARVTRSAVVPRRPGGFIDASLAAGEPQWHTDFHAGGNWIRGELCREAGLHAALAVPIIEGQDADCALEFFSRHVEHPDETLLDTMRAVGREVGQFLVRVQHMTERRRAERALHESEARLAGIIDTAMDAIMSVDEQQRIVLFNDAAEKMFGYSEREVLGQALDLLIPERFRAKHAAAMERFGSRNLTARRMGMLGTITGLRRGGEEFPAEASISHISVTNRQYFTVILRDVTERERAASALAQSEERLSLALESSRLATFDWDVNTGAVLLSEVWNLMLGGEAHPVLTTFNALVQLTDPAERPALEAHIIEVLKGAVPYYHVVHRVRDHAGNWIWIESHGKVTARDANWRATRLIGTHANVTARKRMEEALRESEERYRDLFESTPLPLLVLDEATLKIVLANPAAVEKYGYAHEEFLSLTIVDLQTEDTRDEVARHLRERDPLRPALFARKHLTKDGEVIHAEVTGRPFVFQGRQSRMLLVNDVTERLRAEQALRESEARFRAAFEQAALGMGLRGIDPREPRWLRVNQKLCDIFGYTREELLQLTTVDLTPPDERQIAIDYNEQLLRGTIRAYSREKRYLRKDGRIIWANISLSAIYGADGQPSHIICVVEDITERKQMEQALRESQQQFRQLADNIPQVFWISDAAQRKTLYVSPAIEALIGRPVSELIADRRRLIRAVHEDDRRRLHAARSAAASSGCDVTYRIVRPDGSVRWVRDRGFPVRDPHGNVYRIAGISEDITERLLVEERVRRLNAELEQRVAERTAELQAANRELEAFSYSVSHDLRAPLRTIDGFSQLVMEQAAGKLDPAVEDHLKRVRRASQRMGQLIDDLLALSRVARCELTRSRVDLSALAREVVADLSTLEPGRAVEFAVQPALIVEADHNLVRIALDNLLRNAWKFTGMREHATIEVGRERTGEDLCFFVRDNGVGFDMRYSDKLFGPFQRLHAESQFRGTGIGLAIVQRVVRRHGGEVWAEAAPGQGATFRFTLGSARPAAGIRGT